MRKLRKITESDLHRIVRNVVNEISAGPMGGNGGGADDRVIQLIERAGYEYKINGNQLFVKFVGKGGSTSSKWGGNFSKNDAMKFYTLITNIIDLGGKLEDMKPAGGGVAYIFTNVGKSPYVRPDNF